MPEYIISSANICQIATTFISLFAYLPQWTEILRTKSSANISLKAWCLWIMSSSFALYYAVILFLINGRGLPLIVSSLTGLIFIIFTVALIVRYRPKTKIESVVS